MSNTLSLGKTAPEAPVATPAQSRKIFALVEGHFDEAKGCYTGGYSDEKVAKELNLPRAMVTRLREESGLTIKGDPEVLGLKADIAAMGLMLEDLDKRVRSYELKRAS